MKTTLVLAALVLAPMISRADILMPETSVVTGENANALSAKIKEITKKAPTVSRGREYVSAQATLLCGTAVGGSDTVCKVTVQK